jgi:hypothetical protein
MRFHRRPKILFADEPALAEPDSRQFPGTEPVTHRFGRQLELGSGLLDGH